MSHRAEFVQQNYKPYAGDASFLAPASEATKKIWSKLEDLIHLECEKGALRRQRTHGRHAAAALNDGVGGGGPG